MSRHPDIDSGRRKIIRIDLLLSENRVTIRDRGWLVLGDEGYPPVRGGRPGCPPRLVMAQPEEGSFLDTKLRVALLFRVQRRRGVRATLGAGRQGVRILPPFLWIILWRMMGREK